MIRYFHFFDKNTKQYFWIASDYKIGARIDAVIISAGAALCGEASKDIAMLTGEDIYY